MAKNLIQEAVEEVESLKAHAVENAKNVLAEEMSDRLKNAVTEALNEELGAGGDPPSNYDEDGEQKRKGKNLPADGEDGEDMVDMGDGPAIVEADEDFEDEEEMEDEDEFEPVDDMEEEDELELGDDGDDEEIDIDMEEEGDVDMDVDADEDEYEDEEDVEEVIEVIDDEEDDEEDMQEQMKIMRRKNKTLTLENKKLLRALRILKETVEEVNLFNARLAGTQKISSKYSLKKEQVESVANRFDECESISEVKRTYRALVEGMKYNRKPVRKHRITRNNVSSKPSAVNEGTQFTRMQQLAGVL